MKEALQFDALLAIIQLQGQIFLAFAGENVTTTLS